MEQAGQVVEQVAKKPPMNERFTELVIRQYSGPAKVEFSDRERRLIQGYFVTIDQMLQNAEVKRVEKNASNADHKWDNKLPFVWQNVDCNALAQDLAHYAKVGLDMLEDNMLYPIPFKNSSGDKYIVTLMEGYNGIRYEATKYALVPFKDVRVEVVYSNDTFRPIKKDADSSVETYEFKIEKPFDRGEIVGAFGYIVYDDPTMNKLVFLSRKDIEKRKPQHASPEFWGGTSKTWKNKQQVTVENEGWVHEMFEKTMKREVYSARHIPRDPAKIDDSMRYIETREHEYKDIVIEAEMSENANKTPVVLEALPEKQEDIPTPDLTEEPNF